MSDLVVDTASGSLAFNDTYDDIIYVYDHELNSWTSKAYDSASDLVIKNGNVLFNDTYLDKVHTYSGITHTWHTQSYNSASSIIVSEIED